MGLGCGATRSEIWTGVTIAGQPTNRTTEQGKIGLLSQCNGLWKAEMSKKQGCNFGKKTCGPSSQVGQVHGGPSGASANLKV